MPRVETANLPIWSCKYHVPKTQRRYYTTQYGNEAPANQPTVGSVRSSISNEDVEISCPLRCLTGDLLMSHQVLTIRVLCRSSYTTRMWPLWSAYVAPTMEQASGLILSPTTKPDSLCPQLQAARPVGKSFLNLRSIQNNGPLDPSCWDKAILCRSRFH